MAGLVLLAVPASAQNELRQLEQDAFDRDEPDVVMDERVSRNVGRGYAGAIAGFAVTQVFCAFGALRSNDVDFGQLAKFCGAFGAALGLGLATPTMFRGEGSRWAGLPGSILGTGLGFGLALAPNIPWGVGAVALALVPVALSVLGYQLSDRRARRRERRLRFG